MSAPRGTWLVVRGGALGDFVLTTPAIQAVRRHADRLVLACTPRFAAPWPDLADQVIDLRGPDALWLFGGGPAPFVPDAALVYTPTVAETLRDLGVAHLRSAAPLPSPGSHASDHLAAPVVDLGPGEAPVVQADPERVRAVQALLPHPNPVVLAPGAGGRGKTWPHMERVARELGVPWVWAPGPSEDCPAGPSLPGLDLVDVVALARLCSAWLGNDTGTTHLAAAAGAPTFVLFGPTDPATWCPRGALHLPFDTPPERIAGRLTEAAAHALR